MAQNRIRLIKSNTARHMVITPIARLSFPHLFTPRSFEDAADGIKYYQCDLIFDSKEVLKEAYNGKKTQTPSVMAALVNVKKDQWGGDKDKWPKMQYPAIRDGNERVDGEGNVVAGYKDKVYMKVKSGEKFPPKLIDSQGRPVSESDLYGGCFVRAQLIARPYQFGKNFGVKFTLLQIMKVKDGEKFGMPSDVFDIDDAADDDESADWGESEDDDSSGGDDEEDL